MQRGRAGGYVMVDACGGMQVTAWLHQANCSTQFKCP